jgi:hypothetical protein
MLPSLLRAAAEKSWGERKPLAFFRGGRTDPGRDLLVRLSREHPTHVDAAFTPGAAEVSPEAHCRYKYLINMKGVYIVRVVAPNVW